MVDALSVRSSLAVALASSGALAAYMVVAGCGSGTQENPPNTQAQAQTAAPSDSPGEGHHHHTPPPAAFDACKAKAVGDACTVAWKDGEIQGKCETLPAGSEQSGPACRPEGWRGGGRPHGPPPEIVFAACDGKATGDACSVTFERGTVQGSCMAPRFADGGAGRLLCAPAHHHKHADGGT
jgi:hypothetical protein